MAPELMQPQALPLVLAATGAVAVLALLGALRRPRRARGVLRVAHTSRLRALPSYRRAVRRRRAGLLLTAVVTVGTIALSGHLATRPTLVETRQSQLDNRDIVLCLDVSSSMNDENLAIIQSFRRIATRLQGERIALVAFDGQPLVLFPLTDDYDVVRATLERAEASMSDLRGQGIPDVVAGARNFTLGQSFVGDGLMGCAQQFAGDDAVASLRDDAETGTTGTATGTGTGTETAAETEPVAPAADAEDARSRVILLATDNRTRDTAGNQLFSVAEATQEAAAHGASLVVLDAGRPGSAESQELIALATSTGGAHYPALSGAAAVPEITAIVESLESRTVVGEPVTARFDAPGQAPALVLPLVLGLVVLWRVVRP